MILKKLGLMAILSFALTAVAQDHVIEAVHGMGLAVAHGGQEAHFAVRAARLRTEHGEVVRGRFEFRTRSEHRAIGIECRAVERLGTRGNVAEFGGRAVMSVRTNEGGRRIEGVITGRAVDNRRGDGHGEADHLAVRFRSHDGSVVFEFAGAVRHGDIVVKSRSLRP